MSESIRLKLKMPAEDLQQELTTALSVLSELDYNYSSWSSRVESMTHANKRAIKSFKAIKDQDLTIPRRIDVGSYYTRSIRRRIKSIAEYKRKLSNLMPQLREASLKYDRLCSSIYKEATTSEIEYLDITEQLIHDQLKHLPFIWKYRIDKSINVWYLRVYFKPFEIFRYKPSEDVYRNQTCWGYPFRLTLTIHRDSKVLLNRHLSTHKPEGHRTYLFPHHGCYGSASLHLQNALKNFNLTTFFHIYHEYFTMANMDDPYGSHVNDMQKYSHDVPYLEELTDEHYERYIPSEKRGIAERARMLVEMSDRDRRDRERREFERQDISVRYAQAIEYLANMGYRHGDTINFTEDRQLRAELHVRLRAIHRYHSVNNLPVEIATVVFSTGTDRDTHLMWSYLSPAGCAVRQVTIHRGLPTELFGPEEGDETPTDDPDPAV